MLMPEWEGEEYDVLLRYVEDQANKAKNKGKEEDDGDDDDKDAKYTRVWYAPWKKVKVGGKEKKASIARAQVTSLSSSEI